MKKGQVNLFIIIGIVIIVVVALVFILREESKKEIIPTDFIPIHDFVQDCLKKSSEDSIFQIGQEGGVSFDIDNLNMGDFFYFQNGESNLITKERIEKEISKQIKYSLHLCVQNFNDFKDFKIEEGEISLNSKIEDEKVVIDMLYLLSVSKDDKTTVFKEFGSEVPVRLGVIYNVITKINQETVQNSEAVCVSCIQELAEENDLYIEIQEYDENIIIFTIRDENSKINNEDFKWVFAHDYG